MTNDYFETCYEDISIPPREVISRLENMQDITFTRDQRNILEFLFNSTTDRYLELPMQRRSGKSYLIRMLMERLGNEVHCVFPNYHMSRRAIENGIPREKCHYYGNLITLSEVRPHPEIILCDECAADSYILGIPGVSKVIALYTPPAMAPQEARYINRDTDFRVESNYNPNLWEQVFCDETDTREKEWDDETN